MNFQKISTLTYQKTLLHTLLLRVFKIAESLQCILKRQPHKMVKHTQISRRQNPRNSLSMFDHIVGLALKGLGMDKNEFTKNIK